MKFFPAVLACLMVTGCETVKDESGSMRVVHEKFIDRSHIVAGLRQFPEPAREHQWKGAVIGFSRNPEEETPGTASVSLYVADQHGRLMRVRIMDAASLVAAVLKRILPEEMPVDDPCPLFSAISVPAVSRYKTHVTLDELSILGTFRQEKVFNGDTTLVRFKNEVAR